jgi:hypothetical protein
VLHNCAALRVIKVTQVTGGYRDTAEYDTGNSQSKLILNKRSNERKHKYYTASFGSAVCTISGLTALSLFDFFEG